MDKKNLSWKMNQAWAQNMCWNYLKAQGAQLIILNLRMKTRIKIMIEKPNF